MSGNFDWQTEEDDRRAQNNWDESYEPDRNSPARRQPPWRLITLIVILVVAVGGIIWWRVDRRIDTTLQAFRTDVVASHNLVQRAAADGDEEIFRSVLSGRMPAWTAGELEVFRENLFFDRTPLGLVPVEGTLPVILAAPDEENAAGERLAGIEFSPDLNEAVVTVDQPYLIDGTTETIVLQQTTIFRRGDSRWLLSPPLDGFWGDWLTSEGGYLTLIYPARDKDVAARLAADLDDEIDHMCATLADINCSADLHLTVRLDTDPASLASLSRPLGALQRAREREDILELPAPTLVGLPVADNATRQVAGYEALRDGYARHLLGAVIAQAVGWRCCDDELLFEVLLEYQLGELGLRKWPIGEADYRRVLDNHIRLSDLSVFLRDRFPTTMPEDRLWELRTAVDFLTKGVPGMSAAKMQRTLDQTRNFNQFINGVIAGSNSDGGGLPGNIDLAWWLYAFGGSLIPSQPPFAPPDEDLYLACTGVDGNQSTDTSTLLRYLPDQGKWTEEYKLQGLIWMSGLPNPKMLLMQEFSLAGESWQINTWQTKFLRQDGPSPVYIPEDGNFALSLGETDPSGQRMVAYTNESEFDRVRGFIADLTDCDDDGCATSELAGRPFWSPDGKWAVYVGDESSFPENTLVASDGRYILLQSMDRLSNGPLTLGPGDAKPHSLNLTPIGEGYSPFWLDDQTFGFIRRLASEEPGAQADEDIVIATVEDPTPHTLITAADLYLFLPGEIPAHRLSIAYVATHPRQPDRLFIVVLDRGDNHAYVMIYNRNTRQSEVRLNLLYNLNHSLSFSPDGRYLVLTGQDRVATAPDDTSGVLLVHDIDENRTIPFLTRLPFFLPSAVYDWTEDSRWLAMTLEDNLVGLVAPAEGYYQLVPHGYGSCAAVAWLQP